MSKETLYFVFDVESVGLHGEGYAFGYVVIDENGNEIASGSHAADPLTADGPQDGRDWIEANCPKLIVSRVSPAMVRQAFADTWMEWKRKGAVMVADCPWPVESRFLNDCVRDLQMPEPYPLVDVGSVVLASGGDPVGTFDRFPNEMPKHDPLSDARQSARIFAAHVAAVARLREAADFGPIVYEAIHRDIESHKPLCSLKWDQLSEESRIRYSNGAKAVIAAALAAMEGK